jgi:hypothetical protein
LPDPIPQRIFSKVGLSLQALCFCITAHPATELLTSFRFRGRFPESEAEECMIVEAGMRDDFEATSAGV